MARAYEHRHVVTFEETNLFGNVYYVHFIRWQGICRELFLHECAPEMAGEIARGLLLSTVRCSCRYGAELRPLDTVLIRMRLGAIVWNRIVLEFEYLRDLGGRLEQVAAGDQEIACMERQGDRTVEREIPKALLSALEPFRSDEEGRQGTGQLRP